MEPVADRQLADELADEMGICEVVVADGPGVVLTINGRRREFRVRRGEHACKRRARHVVLLKCPQHGSLYVPICRWHFTVLRKWPRWVAVHCSVCNEKATWVG